MTPLISTLQDLAPQIVEADPADCPAVIGLLEQLKAQAWARMVNPQPVGSRQDENDLLDMAQVAKRLNIPECRAYELARQGKLTTTKIGKYVRVSATELAAFQRRMSNGKTP